MSEENKHQPGSEESRADKEHKQKKKTHDDFPLQEYRLVPVEEWDEHEKGEREIDLIELAKYIWDNRSTIYKFVAVGVVLGLMVALLSPKEYKSGATLMPEVESSQGGANSLLQRYGGLLGMSGGADLGSEGSIPPQLYPQIVQSMPFQLQLLNSEVEFTEFDTTVSVYHFFDEVYTPSVLSYVREYTIGLPGKAIGLFRAEAEEKPLPRGFETDSVISVTKAQMEIIENMRERVSVSLSEETGIINLSVTMPDPYAAAQIAQTSIGLMREYVVNYRTRKAEQDLKFVREQMQNAKTEFEAAQARLAEFTDRNLNLSTARARTQEQQLQSQFNLTFDVYSSLAQQVEAAKLKVQEQTPVVSVLQPVQVPVENSTPNSTVLIMTFALLSLFLSTCYSIITFFQKQK